MISKAHRTIFIHIPKTAGQSVELAVLQDLGLTWDDRALLLLRPNADATRGPERLAHLFGSEYVRHGYCSPEEFDRFFKFAVIRNPYTRAASVFNFRAAQKRGFETFRDYYHAIPDDPHDGRWRHICPQHRYLRETPQHALCTDQLLRFEDLTADWAPVSKRLFGVETPLPRRNISRTNHLDGYALSTADRDFIAETYAEDFALFGYDPLDPPRRVASAARRPAQHV